MAHFHSKSMAFLGSNWQSRLLGKRLGVIVTLGALCTLAWVPALSSQPTSTGLQIGLAATASRPVLSGDAQSYWSPLGSFGPAVGGQASVGYDWSSYGAAVSFEAATASAGPRSGANYGVAVLGYWMLISQIGGAWRPRATLGYVREGVLMNDVMPSETNSSATRIQTTATRARSVGMTGNGARLGLAIERPMNRVSLIAGVDIDMVGFDTVTDDTGTGDTEDISLNRTSWSVIPRLTLGIRFQP